MSAADLRVSVSRLMARRDAEGASLTRVLDEAGAGHTAEQMPRLRAWAYGLARWDVQLQALLQLLMQKPLKARDRDLGWLIKLGLFQLRYSSLAAHTVVDESVKSTRGLDKLWARGLVNAVLRNHQRRREELDAALSDSARLAHPDWLLQRFRADWPDDWRALADAGNRQGPLTLRVNRARIERQVVLERLAGEGLEAQAHSLAPDAISLAHPVGVDRLPGFQAGELSVQDVAAQLAIPLLAGSSIRSEFSPTASSARLLDACAAPGGKTAHALESGRFGDVLAIDRDPVRMTRVTSTLARLGLQATTLVGDAGEPADWWDGQPFDYILLDAPCSGTGVIRRHPDIKQLRRKSDIDFLVLEQRRLLDSLWPLLRPGGVLLYATCSVLKAENEHQIQAFLSRTTDARASELEVPWGRSVPPVQAVGRQILTGEADMDGFFYARLEKPA